MNIRTIVINNEYNINKLYHYKYKMTPDQLLDRMLSFSETLDCPIKKARLINGAYKTWADNSFEANPFNYKKVRKEMYDSKDKFIINTEQIIKKITSYSIRQINNMKKVICIDTKNIYSSATHVSEHFGIKKSTLISKLNGQKVNDTQLMYLVDYNEMTDNERIFKAISSKINRLTYKDLKIEQLEEISKILGLS